MQYVDSSYRNVGNDGNHYNQNILDGSNTSVPFAVRSALYEMSDHLPVRADIRVRLNKPLPDTNDNVGVKSMKGMEEQWGIDVFQNQVRVQKLGRNGTLYVLDAFGRTVYMRPLEKPETWLDMSDFNAGFYTVYAENQSSRQFVKLAVVR